MLTTDEELRRRRKKRLREARGQRGWTQFDLARRVGCSESQIAKIETGRVVPEPWLNEAIAQELGIATWEVGL